MADGASSGFLRSNLVVAGGTALSRITGLARFATLAAVIGQGALSDAYDGANNSPNAIYELLLGGVLSASLVPMFTKHADEGDGEATGAVMGTAIWLLAALTALAVATGPLVFRLMYPNVSGGVSAADYHRVGGVLARFFLVQIFFYGLSALWGAALNARGRFFAAAWSPVLSNVVTIVSLFVVQAELEPGDPFVQALADPTLRRTLGLGATLGIAAMALSMYPAVRRAGVRISLRPDPKHPEVRRLFVLSGWTLGYAAANVITVFVIKNLARPGSGDQSAYSWAFTVFQLPHGLLAMSLVTTLMPTITRRVIGRDRLGVINQVSLGSRLAALVTVPAAALLFVLRKPVIIVLFGHGNRLAPDKVLHTADALAGFSVGLAGFSVYLFVLRAFYAHRDARTPFVINLAECALNVVLAIVLVGRYGVMGLGLAFGLAYVICAGWALQIIGYKLPGFPVRGVLAGIGRMILAGCLTAEACWFVNRLVGGDGMLRSVLTISVTGVVGVAIYVGLLYLLAAPELDEVRGLRG